MSEFDRISGVVERMLTAVRWIRWIHRGTKPAYTSAEKSANVALAAVSRHCARCLNLNGCCFPENNMPPQPLHPNCHCTKEHIDAPTPKAECIKEKFSDYIFDESKNNGKRALFEAWGYDNIDIEWLQKEYVRQANEKYANGDFVLAKLDDYGQRINIVINLPKKTDGKIVSFRSGWMTYPDGIIKLATPFAGGIK